MEWARPLPSVIAPEGDLCTTAIPAEAGIQQSCGWGGGSSTDRGFSLFGGFGGRDRGGGGNAFLIMLAVYAGTILVYFLSQLLIMALSRYREFAADRGGAIVTGAPMQLASALAKISNEMYRIPEKDMRQVEHASAFFIIPALKGDSMMSLFSSHPKVEKRIERLQTMQRQMERGY